MHLASELVALLFLAGLGVMARSTVVDEEAFLGWLFLLAVLGVVGAAVGLCQGPALLSTPGATVIVHFRSRWARVKG